MTRIAILTGTRAEFGLLQPLIDLVLADPETELQLLVTGMHLSPEFGMTVAEIKEHGYPVADEIEILLSSDTAVGTAKSVGLATIGVADSLRRLQPNWLVLLGDRFELLGAASAAMLMGVPIAHIHGGERTEGAVDEAIRHSLTKMASVHFVSAPEHRKRVIQLGEDPGRIQHVGAIGLDRIDRDELMQKSLLAKDLGIDASLPWCVMTYHSVTLEPAHVKADAEVLLNVIRSLPDVYFIITKANADEQGRLINRRLEEFVDTAPNAALFDSLGSHRYLSAVHAAEFVLGNSSSGIFEAPFLHTPTVDVGNRQRGRARGPSVVHAEMSEESILRAVREARTINDPDIFDRSPYYNGGAASPILSVLKGPQPPRVKSFFDVQFELL